MPRLQGFVATFDTEGDMTGDENLWAAMGAADHTVVGATVATAPILGAVYRPPEQVGGHASVQIHGIARVIAGAAVTRGADVTSDGSGRAVTATGVQYRGGIALESASGAGEVIDILLAQSQLGGS